MAGSLRRFLHLERPRKETAPAAGSVSQGRFEAVEVEPAALPEGAPPLPASTQDRFRAPEGSGLALDVATDGAQPFVRCARCEADHARDAARCDRCGADLQTPEQRAYNDQLWAARQREAEEQEREATRRREELRRDQQENARAQRAAAEAMGEAILQRERARAGGSWGWRLLGRLGQLLGARLDD